jgi:pimeloyl-ACP methyl ester carboxylesterase
VKLILLPGLDGTGNLFSPILSELSKFDCEVIPLPETGDQDYITLTAWVRKRLPEQDFILIAESFSGPIAAALAVVGIKNLRGIIFVATFLSPPNMQLIKMARALPIKFLSSLPLAAAFHRVLFLGKGADKELVRLFQSTVSALSSALIKARLSSILSLPLKLEVCELPVVYIRATEDRLVSATKVDEFSRFFNNITFEIIDAPHFVLQARPVECAAIIYELAHML